MASRHGEPQRSWWSRNWVWSLPCGCLGCFGLMIGSCALFLGGLFSAVRTSEGWQEVLAEVQSHPEVVAAMGEPIEAGWMFQGNIDVSGSTKTVDVSVPISGPDGGGRLYVEGEEVTGVWTFQRLEVQLDNGDWIDLLKKPDRALEG